MNNEWPPERIVLWLEQALVCAATVRKNIAIGWGELKIKEIAK